MGDYLLPLVLEQMGVESLLNSRIRLYRNRAPVRGKTPTLSLYFADPPSSFAGGPSEVGAQLPGMMLNMSYAGQMMLAPGHRIPGKARSFFESL